MGLFSSKKKTYVSSVAYPLGEDDDKRVDYLQYTVLNATLQNRPIGESITQGYLRGQGMALRNAFKYARDHYTHGVPSSSVRYMDQVDPSLITPLLQPKYPGADIMYLANVVGTADFEWWAEKFLAETYGYDRVLQEFIRPPPGVDYNAAVAYDLEPSGLIRILLMNTGGATTVIDHRPAGYAFMATFLHSAYRARTVFTELDETTTRPAGVGEIDSASLIVTILDQVGETQERRERTETTILAGVATIHRLITVTVTTRPQYLLYKIGSGTYPTLDAWLQDEDLLSPYYPSVPLRVNNVDMVAETKQNTELYKTSKKLLKRAGLDIDKLGEQVNDNESVGDIDFAFVVFGVALNTKSQEGKRYLFRWFEHLRNLAVPAGGIGTLAEFSSWEAAYTSSTSTAPKINSVNIFSPKERANNHDVKIQWNYIDTQLKAGVIFAGAKPGDCDVGTTGVRTEHQLAGMDLVLDNSKLYARRQIDADSYQEMVIAGLVHENFIYQGKSTTVTAYEAFHDEDEEGFIVPLNQQIVRSMPLVELTDLSYQCTHMVFNCYKVVKQKWYQTGIFKAILVIVAILVVFFTWGAGTPIAISLLGATIVVAGTLMVLLAATLYVLAMMVIMNILMKVAIDVFGEKWGPVIAAMIAVISQNWQALSRLATTIATTGITATMVMQASIAALQVYGAYNQGQMSDVQKKLAGLETEFDVKMKEIEELSKANLDTNADLIDIYGMTQATNLTFESSAAFLGRTLITGSDVAEITNGLIESFADVGLQLPNTG